MRFFSNHLILLLLFITIKSNANNYINYSVTSNNVHHVSLINPESFELSNSIKLGSALNEDSLVFTNKNSSLIAIYLQQNTENDDLIVLNKNTLDVKARLNIKKNGFQNEVKLNLFSVYISNDDKNISVVSTDDKSSHIDLYDINNGQSLLSKSIKGHGFKFIRSKDLNYLAIQYTTKKNHIIRVININSLKTTALQNLGQYPVVTHVFNNSMMISSEKPHPRTVQYKLSKLDFETNTITSYESNSLKPYVFVSDKDQKEAFVIGRNTTKKKDLFVVRFDKSDNFLKTDYKKKSNPINAVLNDNNSRLMIIGEDKLSTINLENNTLQTRIRIPFDPLDGIINANGTIGYLQENNGSQVGNFDLVAGKLIEQSSAGRFMSQVLVNSRKTVLKLLIVGLVPNVIEMLFSRNDSNKNIMLSNDENQLFVINATTNDLTIFDAKLLKKSSSNGTGAKSFLMSQGPHKNSPILIIGEKKISVIDNQDNSLILSLEKAKLAGLDKVNDILFYSLNGALNIYDMKNKKELKVFNNSNSLAVYDFESY